MRILHTSDLHLNSPMRTKLSGEKARERRREMLISFRKMTEYARREGCSAIIIAGDLFDSDRPTLSAMKYVKEVIEASSDLVFFYLPGNHERRVLMQYGNLPENLRTFGDEWTSFAFGDVFITGRATTSPDMFNKLALPEGAPIIAVLHGELREKSDTGGVIGRREIEKSHVSYLALGHYHSYREEKIGECTAVYCGTPEGRGFDECGDMGFVIIDTGHTVSHRFIRGFGRGIRISEIRYEPGLTTPELEERMLAHLSEIPKSDLVRVRLTGRRSPEDRIETALIERHIGEKFYYFEIKDETGLSISAEDYRHDRSLKGELIRLVLGDDGLSDEEKDRVINCALSALMGEKYDSGEGL